MKRDYLVHLRREWPVKGEITSANWQTVEAETVEDAAKAAVQKCWEYFRYLGAITVIVQDDGAKHNPTTPGTFLHAVRLAWKPEKYREETTWA